MTISNELFIAVLKNNILDTQKLLESFVGDINDTEVGDTLLFIAIGHGGQEVVEMLLEKGANPNLKNKSGDAPLHDIFRCCQAGIIPLLVKYGADVNLPNARGQTPLHIAMNYDVPEFVDELLRNGARSDLVDANGLTPEGIIEQSQRLDIYLGLQTSKQKSTEKLQLQRHRLISAAITQMDDAIANLRDHGMSLKNANVSKGNGVVELANRLQGKSDELKETKDAQKLADIRAMIKDAQSDTSMMEYRGCSPILKNILIACTFVGLFILAGKAIHSRVTTGRYSLFFTSTTENTIFSMKNHVDQLQENMNNLCQTI